MYFFKRLEDPEYPLLGPILKGLKLFRLWEREHSSPWQIYNCIHVYFIIFVISQFVELWMIRDDLDLALRNLSLTMLGFTNMIKTISFIYWQKDWISLIDIVSNLEKQQLSEKDETTVSIMKDYTKYSRKITYFYWILVIGTGLTVALTPLVGYHLASADCRYIIKNGTAPYPQILSSWLPFDTTRGYGYWISVVVHLSHLVFGGGVIACYDSNVIALMSFFKGQLQILSKNCERLFGDKNDRISYGEAVKRIKKCSEHHAVLARLSSCLNSMLSPVMFLYVIICSLMICASVIQMSKVGLGIMQRLWIAEYVLALIAQLFLYCWHANEVLFMSMKVDEGAYLSSWWAQSVNIHTSIVLLGGQLDKRFVFTAGPFVDLNVATFVTIIRGAYTYYTFFNSIGQH